MANIQFVEDQEYQRPVQVEQKPYFIRLVLATKIVSTEKQANYVLIAVSLLVIFFGAYLLFFSVAPAAHPHGLPPPPPGGWQSYQPPPTHS